MMAQTSSRVRARGPCFHGWLLQQEPDEWIAPLQAIASTDPCWPNRANRKRTVRTHVIVFHADRRDQLLPALTEAHRRFREARDQAMAHVYGLSAEHAK